MSASIAASVPAKANQPSRDLFRSLTNGSATMTAMPKTERTTAGRMADRLIVAKFIENQPSPGLRPPSPGGRGRVIQARSEERRVGKECESRWWLGDRKKKEESHVGIE